MKPTILPLIISALGLLSVSCVHNDPYDKSCDLYLDVRSLDGNNAQISDVALYIYDGGGNLLGYHNPDAGVAINIGQYLPYGTIKAVAWGNALGNSALQTLSEPTVGSAFNSHNLTQNLSPTVFVNTPIINEPSDLFYGSLDISFADSKSATIENTKSVLIDRFVSSYILTVRHLASTFNGPGGDYKVIIRHPQKGAIFDGTLTAGEVVYMPKTTYNTQADELNSTVSIALPTGSSTLIIEIYSGANLIYKANTDSNDNTILLLPNKLHHILIDFNHSGLVTLITGNWGKIIIDEEFD